MLHSFLLLFDSFICFGCPAFELRAHVLLDCFLSGSLSVLSNSVSLDASLPFSLTRNLIFVYPLMEKFFFDSVGTNIKFVWSIN